MKNIIWLASYPKSGNTWFRIFLNNLLCKGDEPFDINTITSTNGIASSREFFDQFCALESSELTLNEIDQLRPEVYQVISTEATKTLFIKVHDAYTYLPDNKPLFPSSVTKGVVYIIRNPLDVTVSFANHQNCSVQKSIELMANNKYCLSNNKKSCSTQLRQKLLSWDNHAKSWVSAQNIPMHVMRYEDMKLNTLETFASTVNFMGLKYSVYEIEKAINKSKFEDLQKQEIEKGFKEKTPKAKIFFRKGEIGNWRKHLNREQVETIIKNHKGSMLKHGYLTHKGDIVF